MRKSGLALVLLAAALLPSPADADEAKVLNASAIFSLSYKGEDIFSVSATVAHADTGS